MRLRHYILFLAVATGALVSGIAKSQTRLRINIGEDSEFRCQSKTFIYGYFVNQKFLIDSTFGTSVIDFELDKNLPVGLYSIMVYTDIQDNIESKYQRVGFDLILDGNDVQIDIELTREKALGMVSAKSGENSGYYGRFNNGVLRKNRIDVLTEALEQYPPEGDGGFENQLRKKLNQLIEQARSEEDEIVDYPVANYYYQIQKELSNSSIENINFSDSLLKHSPYIPRLIRQYLELPDLTAVREIVPVTTLIQRVDEVCQLTKADEIVYERMLLELKTYFDNLGNHELVLYLNQEYLIPELSNNSEKVSEILEENIDLGRLFLGKKAPDIPLDTVGSARRLHDLQNQFTILVFWDSDCQKCRDFMEGLNAFYQQRTNEGFMVVAMALDVSPEYYYEYVSERGFDWLDITDFSGWDSDVVETYRVMSTPSVFVLDSELRIIDKPKNIGQLQQFFALIGH